MPLLTLQAFDYPMSLNEAISEMFDAGVQDDSLTLLYEANKDVMMTVKTPSGMTEPQFLEPAVCQGGTWGPSFAAEQVDTIGKEQLEGIVSIPVLGMIDDTLSITEAGMFMNVKSADKGLQFGYKKCKSMFGGRRREKYQSDDLYVDTWKIECDKQHSLIETFDGKTIMDNTEEMKYLQTRCLNNCQSYVHV
jgi:hypothetical protein